MACTNAYEKEIEQLLVTANNVIAKQKEIIAKAQEGNSWKDKITALEKAHIEERNQSQAAFSGYQTIL